MTIHRLLLVVLVTTYGLCSTARAFVSPPASSSTVSMKKARLTTTATPGYPIIKTSLRTKQQQLQMAHLLHPTPTDDEKKTKNPIIALTAVALALAVATTHPPPLEEGYLAQHHFPPVEPPTHILVSKLEVTPLGGGGFGGLGFGLGPGFVPVPFGGFGLGFQIRNRPSPPPPRTEEQIIQSNKERLQSVKEYERNLEERIKAMENQRILEERIKGLEQQRQRT